MALKASKRDLDLPQGAQQAPRALETPIVGLIASPKKEETLFCIP